MASSSTRTIITTLLLLLSTLLTAAEPAQYCKFSDPSRPNQAIDFCLGLLTHHNATTGAHDLYATFTTTRRQRSAVGWTAVGVGDTMTGSLMFIVYGDPASGEAPIVSIRASTGHAQPTLITPHDLGGADLRVLRADWIASPSDPTTSVATVSLVCMSCTLWPGTALSATASAQPWIWAWNADQVFDLFAYDTHLRMHAHHAGNGGWGNFYVDMARAESDAAHLPSLPPIRPGVAALGASEAPGLAAGLGSWVRHDPMLHLHGLAMALAFLVVFPAGVVAMRSGSAKAFKYHWIIQAAASGVVAVGCVVGFVLRGRVDTTHQVVGLLVVVALGVQGVLGWKHHVDFLRIRRRTIISHAHIWAGRVIMVGGYVNLALGMLLRGYSTVCLALAGSFMVLEASGVGVYVWRAQRRAARGRKVVGHPDDADEDAQEKERRLGADRYFSIASDDDEKDSMDEETEAAEAKASKALM